MDKKFTIGDIVILKSGGPTMTVTRYVETVSMSEPRQYSGRVQCTWFFENVLNKGEFPQDALEKEE